MALPAALSLCLLGAGLAGAPVHIATPRFTLAWSHSIEHVRWEEDYELHPSGLRLLEARVLGSAAGMEPGEGAVLRDGVWHYRPALPDLPELVLAHSSGYTQDYQLCLADGCHALAHWLPPAGPLTLRPCPAAGN